MFAASPSAYVFPDSELPPVICLMGATASGKTALAMQLVRHLPCDIVSVDSALVYRGLNIGSAKPSADELLVAPHRLIDIREPHEPYSAADFCCDALSAIDEIHAQGRVPLLVGGTMLYFKALLDGLSELPAADATIRARLNREISEQGHFFLHQRLVLVDPVAAARIHENDSQRLIRALEVYELTNKTLTELQQGTGDDSFRKKFNVRCIALAPQNRNKLHDRIAQRFNAMLAQGLIEEVKTLYDNAQNSADLPAMRSVGYRQVWAYLQGELTYQEMLEKGIIATRQLAKHQLTWLRSWPELSCFEGDEDDLLLRVLALLPLQARSSALFPY